MNPRLLPNPIPFSLRREHQFNGPPADEHAGSPHSSGMPPRRGFNPLTKSATDTVRGRSPSPGRSPVRTRLSGIVVRKGLTSG